MERHAQDRQWGGPEHDDHHTVLDWAGLIEHHLDRLGREMGEPAGDGDRDSIRRVDTAVRRRLTVVAALAIAAIESVDRRSEQREAQWADIDQAVAGDHAPEQED